MGVVMISANGGVLDGAVHAFDLAVGPRMIRFGEAVIDVVASAGVFKGMSAEDFPVLEGETDVGGGRSGIARGGEVSAVVGEDGVDAVRKGSDQLFEELRRRAAVGLGDESCKGEFGSAVDGDEKEELAFCGANFGEIDMEIADGVGLELLAGWAGGVEVWQTANAVTLKATVQSGAGEVRNGGLESVKAIVEREQGVFAEGHGDGFLFAGERRGTRLLRPHGSVINKGAPLPLLDRFGVDPVTLRELQEALLTMLDRPTHRRRCAGAAVK